MRRQRDSGRRRKAPSPVHGTSTRTRSKDSGCSAPEVAAVSGPDLPGVPRNGGEGLADQLGTVRGGFVGQQVGAPLPGEGTEQSGLAAGSGAQIQPALPRVVTSRPRFPAAVDVVIFWILCDWLPAGLPAAGVEVDGGHGAGHELRARRPGPGCFRHGPRRAGQGHRRWTAPIPRRVRPGWPRLPEPHPGCRCRAAPRGSPRARRCRLRGAHRSRQPAGRGPPAIGEVRGRSTPGGRSGWTRPWWHRFR